MNADQEIIKGGLYVLGFLSSILGLFLATAWIMHRTENS